MKNRIALMLLTLFVSSCKQKGNFSMPTGVPLNINLKGNFALEKEYENGNSKTYVFKAAEDYLMITKVDSLDETVALNYRIDKLSLVNSLFTDQGTPYPGKVTNHQGCPNEYKPVIIIDSKEIYALSIKANQRLVYGGCTDASVFYSSALVFCYCQSAKSLFEIKYFTPIGAPANDLKAVAESVSCL